MVPLIVAIAIWFFGAEFRSPGASADPHPWWRSQFGQLCGGSGGTGQPGHGFRKFSDCRARVSHHLAASDWPFRSVDCVRRQSTGSVVLRFRWEREFPGAVGIGRPHSSLRCRDRERRSQRRADRQPGAFRPGYFQPQLSGNRSGPDLPYFRIDWWINESGHTGNHCRRDLCNRSRRGDQSAGEWRAVTC